MAGWKARGNIVVIANVVKASIAGCGNKQDSRVTAAFDYIALIRRLRKSSIAIVCYSNIDSSVAQRQLTVRIQPDIKLR